MAVAVVSAEIFASRLLEARPGNRPGGLFHHHDRRSGKNGRPAERVPSRFFWRSPGSPVDSLDAACTGTQTMSAPVIHTFNHSAMATQFQVRIADAEKTYAAQAAQAAFTLTDELESHLSRFRANSDIARIAQLVPGGKMRLSEPVFACLEIAKKMETATHGAFSVTAAALKSQPAQPQWTLLKEQFSLRCDVGKLEFDLG